MNPATEHRKLTAIMFTDMVGYSALSQRNEALQVRSLALDKSYLDPGHDAVALGRQQKVDGSVERVGSQIRLVPRLIRVADASVLWSEPHQRRVEDLFGLQQELVTDIAACQRTVKKDPQGRNGALLEISNSPPSAYPRPSSSFLRFSLSRGMAW
ncbi:MAG TPA: hypothetical protein VI136_06975, partial [Verrucomicrobiae bacterium]